MSAVMLGPKDPPQKVQVGNYTLQARIGRFDIPCPADARGTAAGDRAPAAAILIAAGPDEYYAIGSGVKVTFSPNTPGPPFAGLGTVEQGTFVDGRWVPDIRLAGDDTGQGADHLRTPAPHGHPALYAVPLPLRHLVGAGRRRRVRSGQLTSTTAACRLRGGNDTLKRVHKNENLQEGGWPRRKYSSTGSRRTIPCPF